MFVIEINSRVTIAASLPESYHFLPSFSREEDREPWEQACQNSHSLLTLSEFSTASLEKSLGYAEKWSEVTT